MQIIEKPSKIKSKFWLHAEIKKGIYKPYSEKSGKWLLFIPREQIDQTWAVIKKYTEDGRLSGEAKVSTAKKNPNAIRENVHVICIYTYDWEDKEDVMRIGVELRKLDFTKPISYKTDGDTLAEKYLYKGDKKISKYFE